MIGPGWMPSQPRPLGRMRRGLVCYARYARRRPRRRTERSRARDAARPPSELAFAGAPAELPIATVLSSGSQVLAGDLQRWLVERWAWLRPRTIPLVVAGVAMVMMLGAMDHLTYAPAADPRAHAHATDDTGRVRITPWRPVHAARTTSTIPVDIIYVVSPAPLRPAPWQPVALPSAQP